MKKEIDIGVGGISDGEKSMVRMIICIIDGCPVISRRFILKWDESRNWPYANWPILYSKYRIKGYLYMIT